MTEPSTDKLKAVDLLRAEALRWQPGKGEYWHLVRNLIKRLELEFEFNEAKSLKRLFKDIDDKYHILLAEVAKYESPQLAKHALNEVNTSFVVFANAEPQDIIDYARKESKRMIKAKSGFEKAVGKAADHTNRIGFDADQIEIIKE